MNVLIVDDHPMIVDGYVNALQKEKSFKNAMIFYKSFDCETAYQIISRLKLSNANFDIAIIDFGLPSYEDMGLYDGSNLATLLQKNMPSCKIIMVTAHTEILKVYDINKRIRPDGLITKNDVSPENLVSITKLILDGTTYQSPTVKKCISEIWKKELMVEDYNRQILFYLSKGIKAKDLDKVITISYSAIQKRIIKMKKAFDVTDDSGLVNEAIKLNFI